MLRTQQFTTDIFIYICHVDFIASALYRYTVFCSRLMVIIFLMCKYLDFFENGRIRIRKNKYLYV